MEPSITTEAKHIDLVDEQCQRADRRAYLLEGNVAFLLECSVEIKQLSCSESQLPIQISFYYMLSLTTESDQGA
jgi:hypothetical protein